MYGIFTYISLIFMVNLGKNTIHGSYGHPPGTLILLRIFHLRSRWLRRRISSWHRSLPAQFLQSASWDNFIWFWAKAGWWFQTFFIFIPILGRFPFWRAYFSKGLKPPTRKVSHVVSGIFGGYIYIMRMFVAIANKWSLKLWKLKFDFFGGCLKPDDLLVC